MAVEDFTTRAAALSMVDIDLISSQLMGTLAALAALTGEVTVALTDSEIETAKFGLVFEALRQGRELRKFFESSDD
jgi:hypothetical protein